MTPPLKIFVAGYTPAQVAQMPRADHLVPVDLSTLKLGHLQRNELAESRLLLSDMHLRHPAEYQGIATWRWPQKCPHLMQLPDLDKLPIRPDTVYAAWLALDWYRHSELSHPGIKKYLFEMFHVAGVPAETRMGLYANQFICHHSVYADFIAFFRRIFAHFHAKYGLKYDYFVAENDRPRTPAVLYERIATLYFASRQDLNIIHIPHAPRPERIRHDFKPIYR